MSDLIPEVPHHLHERCTDPRCRHCAHPDPRETKPDTREQNPQ